MPSILLTLCCIASLMNQSMSGTDKNILHWFCSQILNVHPAMVSENCTSALSEVWFFIAIIRVSSHYGKLLFALFNKLTRCFTSTLTMAWKSWCLKFAAIPNVNVMQIHSQLLQSSLAMAITVSITQDGRCREGQKKRKKEAIW